ncbi:MAG: DUF2272 domain-containing protein [Alphaproteobacteria bacterium]|jgi:hypothetical protein|nr:DUF2272 domain-containing protein [Alphaproteobacteria bacterium]
MAQGKFMPPCLLWQGSFLGGPASKLRIMRIAIEEWIWFGQQILVGSTKKDAKPIVSQQGRQEHEGDAIKRVAEYWNNIGLKYDGEDRDKPWSAAFISWVMAQAAVPEKDFPRSRRHMTWIHHAICNKLDGKTGATLIGHKLDDDYIPQTGDLIGYSRSSWLDYAAAGKQQYGKSHSDIVVYAWPGEIGVIGGNVNHSVSLKRLPADDKGRLTDKCYDWFVVLENRLSWT